MEKNIFLMGFMGSGKTRVGQLLAQRLGKEFIDTDQLIEEKTGKSIPEIFAQQGEEGFRQLERLCLKEAAQKVNAVISLGGGAPCYAENLNLIRQGVSIYISCPPEVIFQRIKSSDNRPLLAGLSEEEKLEKINSLLARRERFYYQADIIVETGAKDSPEEVVERIVKKLQDQLSQDMKIVNVSLGERSYPIYIGTGSLLKLGELCRQHKLSHRIAVVTNPVVAKFYLATVEKSLTDSGYQTLSLTIPDGEQYKSLETLDKLFESLIRAQFDREATILALGGGVVGDIAGLAAATFLRGVRYVQVPTTLLAQVDASVGGKVAVNHRLGKNLIGAFYQPQFVLIDPAVLKTLPKRELRSGMAEVIKHALIRDAELFERLEDNLEELLNLTAPSKLLTEVIARNCEIKAEIVSKDEREQQGLRTILNYGHTVGHALEAATEYRYYRHGEAVLLGMLVAAQVASQMGLLAKAEAGRQNQLLERIGFPLDPPDIPIHMIMEKMKSDKKIKNGQLRFVLLPRIGEAIVSGQVTQDQIEQGMRSLKWH